VKRNREELVNLSKLKDCFRRKVSILIQKRHESKKDPRMREKSSCRRGGG
jgi:hypothetical protein